MSLETRSLWGAAWSFVEKVGTKLVGASAFLVLARLLDPEAFGLVALAAVFIAGLEILRDQGFADAIVQRDPLEQTHLDTAFWMNCAIGVSLAGACAAAADPIAGLYGLPELAPILRWLSLALAIQSLSAVQKCLLRRQMAFKALTQRALAAVSCGALVGVGMAVAGFGVESLVAQQLVEAVVSLLLFWHMSDYRPGPRISSRAFRELYSFGGYVFGVSLLNFANRRLDQLLIGIYLGPVLLGTYVVSIRFVRMLIQLTVRTGTSVAFPALSRMQDDPARMKAFFYRGTRLGAAIGYPAFFGMAALAPEITLGIFGEKWAQSIPVMQVIAFLGVSYVTTLFIPAMLKAGGRPGIVLGLLLANASLNTVGLLVAMPWGITAVATALVARALLFAPIELLVLRRLMGVDLSRFASSIGPPLAAAALMYGAVIAAKHAMGPFSDDVLGRLLFGALVAATSYLAFLRALAPELFERLTGVLADFRRARTSGGTAH